MKRESWLEDGERQGTRGRDRKTKVAERRGEWRRIENRA